MADWFDDNAPGQGWDPSAPWQNTGITGYGFPHGIDPGPLSVVPVTTSTSSNGWTSAPPANGGIDPVTGLPYYAPGSTVTPSSPHLGGTDLYNNANAFQKAWFDSGGKNVSDLASFVKAHPEYGAQVTGSKGSKVTFANGQTFQAVRSAGINGGIGAAWDDLNSPQANGNPANTGVTPFSYKPFTDTFSYADYQPTTQAEVEADPGFKERLNLGLDTIQHSAAAKGSILSGQTLNDLNQYAQGYASNETAAVDARRRADYATNYGNALQQFQQKWQQYQQGWQNAFNSWGANANLAQTNWQNAYNLANQQFGFNQQNWQNQYSLASLGLQAALGAANAGGNYANSAGNLITGAGNAQAAGTVGSGNAWNSAFGNLANYGSTLPYWANIYGNRGSSPASGMGNLDPAVL